MIKEFGLKIILTDDLMKNKDQVELSELIFSMNWEDPASDCKALAIKPGDSVMTITSGGCNTLEFLLYDPSVIYSVDINPAQSYLMELKIAGIQHLEFGDFSMLMGLQPSHNRKDIYGKLKTYLSAEAQVFWDKNPEIISKGILMSGRYEKFILLAGKIIRLLQGRNKVKNIFSDKNAEQQKEYFDKVFNTWQLKALFPLLFNKKRLAKKGLIADYFHFDDGSKSFAESFYNRAKNALRNIPVKNNYFLSLYLTGWYRNVNEVPEYLKESNFKMLKERAGRIQVITMDANDWLRKMEDGSMNAFSLSNICELKSDCDTTALFKEVARSAKIGAHCCFRNLMIPREIPKDLQDIIVKDELFSKRLLSEDRSFVYGKVASYVIHK
jgi:S-adenosylmethionine-diacylglycerol 3-amino-3-carboxypropyl transferase